MFLPVFLPAICMTSKLRQNASVIIFINRQKNSNKILPEKNINKNFGFLNVLSIDTSRSSSEFQNSSPKPDAGCD